jgi:hypothetical protein
MIAAAPHPGRHRLRRALLLAVGAGWLLLAAFETTAAAAPAPDSDAGPRDRWRIGVLTVGPGEALFTRFGHIGLVVEDRQRRRSLLFNYGTFDFDDPGLRWQYLRGNLIYWLSVAPLPAVVRAYRRSDRRVVIRWLALDRGQAATVVALLRQNARPQNRRYAYRHYLDNCSTRVRDLLDRVLGGVLRRHAQPLATGRTYRWWTRRALAGLWATAGVIDYLLAGVVDRPLNRWQEYFLPAPLGRDLELLRAPSAARPLVAERRLIAQRRGPPVGSRVPLGEWLPLMLVGGLLLLGLGLPLLIGPRAAGRRLLGLGLLVWGLAAGAGGLLLTLMWALTEHVDTHANENLLVTPPLLLWLVVPGVRLLLLGRLGRSARWAGATVLLGLALIAVDLGLKLGPGVQDNWFFIGLAAVCNAAALGGLWRVGLVRPAPPADHGRDRRDREVAGPGGDDDGGSGRPLGTVAQSQAAHREQGA